MKGLLLLSVFITIGISGCGSDETLAPTSDESATEIGISSLMGVIQSSESSGTLARAPVFTFLASALASNTCPTVSEATCSGQLITLRYGACKFSKPDGSLFSGVWYGGQELTFSLGATCDPNPANNTMGNMTKVFLPGSTRATEGGVVVGIDSTSRAGWETLSSGGALVAFAPGKRDIYINGITYDGIKPYELEDKSRMVQKVWNYTVTTPEKVVVNGTGTSRTIASGVVKVQNNTLSYSGTISVSPTLVFSADCCLPTGGKVRTELTGSRVGVEFLEFKNKCGTALFTDHNGTTREIELKHCL